MKGTKHMAIRLISSLINHQKPNPSSSLNPRSLILLRIFSAPPPVAAALRSCSRFPFLFRVFGRLSWPCLLLLLWQLIKVQLHIYAEFLGVGPRRSSKWKYGMLVLRNTQLLNRKQHSVSCYTVPSYEVSESAFQLVGSVLDEFQTNGPPCPEGFTQVKPLSLSQSSLQLGFKLTSHRGLSIHLSSGVYMIRRRRRRFGRTGHLEFQNLFFENEIHPPNDYDSSSNLQFFLFLLGSSLFHHQTSRDPLPHSQGRQGTTLRKAALLSFLEPTKGRSISSFRTRFLLPAQICTFCKEPRRQLATYQEGKNVAFDHCLSIRGQRASSVFSLHFCHRSWPPASKTLWHKSCKRALDVKAHHTSDWSRTKSNLVWARSYHCRI